MSKSKERAVFAERIAESAVGRAPSSPGVRFVWRIRDEGEDATEWAILEDIPERTIPALRVVIERLAAYAYDRGFEHGRYGRIASIALGSGAIRYDAVEDDEGPRPPFGFAPASSDTK